MRDMDVAFLIQWVPPFAVLLWLHWRKWKRER